MRCCLFSSPGGTRAIVAKWFVASEKALTHSREQNLRCFVESARPHSTHVRGTGLSLSAPRAALAPLWLRRGAKNVGSGGLNADNLRPLCGSVAGLGGSCSAARSLRLSTEPMLAA